MAHLSVMTVCLISAFAFHSTECSTIAEALDSNIEVKIVDSLADFLEANPDVSVQKLEREEVFDETTNKATLIHHAGRRINGDRLLTSDSANYQYATLQDVTLTLNYPKTGLGAVVTFFEVVVDQTSNLGQAMIVSGGIGQRRITVIVEAKQTLLFRYRASVYGY